MITVIWQLLLKLSQKAGWYTFLQHSVGYRPNINFRRRLQRAVRGGLVAQRVGHRTWLLLLLLLKMYTIIVTLSRKRSRGTILRSREFDTHGLNVAYTQWQMASCSHQCAPTLYDMASLNNLLYKYLVYNLDCGYWLLPTASTRKVTQSVTFACLSVRPSVSTLMFWTTWP